VSDAGLLGVHSGNRDQHRPPRQRPQCLIGLPGKILAKESGESTEQKRAAKRAKVVRVLQTGLAAHQESLKRRTPAKFGSIMRERSRKPVITGGPGIMRRRTNPSRAREPRDIGNKRVEEEHPGYSDRVGYIS